MPHPKLPPTPATSSDITALEKHPTLDTAFVLPPAAMSFKSLHSPSDAPITESKPAAKAHQPSPPISPAQRPTGSSPRHKRTLSGTNKAKATSSSSNLTTTPSPEFTLPPPPQRTRKIIQMTPKVTPQPSTSGASSVHSRSSGASPSTPKRKQPSSTSAAGRKIARKTAHSIIERRRRSKMNEEFGVLKDMIPACSGQEMHKLAILQAGIEYMRYLEGCVGELKGRRKDKDKESVPAKRAREVDDEDEDFEPVSPKTTKIQSRKRSFIFPEASPDLVALSETTSTPTYAQASRQDSLASISNSTSTSASVSRASTPRMTPIQTHLTPAFGAIQFSPDIQRRSPYVLPNPVSHTTSANPSPHILPLPALNSILDVNPGAQFQFHDDRDRDQEATATAALMMLTHDRRGFGDRDREQERARDKDEAQRVRSSENLALPAAERAKERPVSVTKGMSVRDLLSA